MNDIVSKVGNFHVRGNVMDAGWFQNLRHENGKANLNAIVILSEIIYWYKPVEVRDEVTGELIGYKKKFKADKLQKSYQSLADSFGLTKGQAKSACKFLKDKGLIHIEFRNVTTKTGQNLANVMFIEPIIDEIIKISGSNNMMDDSNSNKPPKGIDDEICLSNSTPTNVETVEVCNSSNIYTDFRTIDICSSNHIGMALEQQTNTEITTKNTTEITTESKKNIYSPLSAKIIDFLNEKAGTNFKSSSRATRTVIKGRLNEGFKLDDFLKVINIKTTEWMGTEYEKYLRPQTLFGSKFEGYLNQKSSNNRISTSYHNKNPSDSFSNRKQRKYDMGSLEKRLLGWE